MTGMLTMSFYGYAEFETFVIDGVEILLVELGAEHRVAVHYHALDGAKEVKVGILTAGC